MKFMFHSAPPGSSRRYTGGTTLRRLPFVHDDLGRREAAVSDRPKKRFGGRGGLSQREPHVGESRVEIGQRPLDARQPDERVLDVGHSRGAGDTLNLDDRIGGRYLVCKCVDAARGGSRAADEAHDENDESKPV